LAVTYAEEYSQNEGMTIGAAEGELIQNKRL